ncbi:MAG: hypothetical protein WC521_07875 [Bdellovibrionales bacterium]|jgi:hypothetical protein
MFRRKTPTVRVGDRFVKLDDSPGRVWVVVDVWIPSVGLPHALVKDEGHGQETRIISVSTLVDRRFCSPLQSS